VDGPRRGPPLKRQPLGGVVISTTPIVEQVPV
jgi:hypothetical protein